MSLARSTKTARADLAACRRCRLAGLLSLGGTRPVVEANLNLVLVTIANLLNRRRMCSGGFFGLRQA